MNDEKPTHLDLFSGTGAFSIAFEREGFRTIGFAEIDPYCCALLNQNWPTIRNYGNIADVPDTHCSVITGGPPCQAISIAGRRKGAADNRYLWPATLELIGRCRADWLCIENVANVTNLFLNSWQNDLEAIGYQSQAFDIPSCAVGLSSVERHVWLIAARRTLKLQRCGQERLQGGGLQPCIRRTDNATLENIGAVPDLPDAKLLRSTKGFPHFRDRIAAIGNAVPPPIAQIFARAIFQTLSAGEK